MQIGTKLFLMFALVNLGNLDTLWGKTEQTEEPCYPIWQPAFTTSRGRHVEGYWEYKDRGPLSRPYGPRWYYLG